jgi:hypothetical protein
MIWFIIETAPLNGTTTFYAFTAYGISYLSSAADDGSEPVYITLTGLLGTVIMAITGEQYSQLVEAEYTAGMAPVNLGQSTGY